MIKNGKRYDSKNKMSMDKINNFYLWIAGASLCLTGMRVGIERISKKALK